MRVVSGTAKGRKLLSVPGSTTRPILDRVKTALFDTLRPDLPGMLLLDLFAGTGAVGIEALSQGAERCIFIERDEKACETVRKNLEITNFEARAEVFKTDAFQFLKNTDMSFDLIYVAPPQYRKMWQKALRQIDARPALLNAGGRVIIQIDPREYQPQELASLSEQRQRKYGSTLLIFYEQSQAEEKHPHPTQA